KRLMNLAGRNRDAQRYEEAEPLYRRLVAIDEKTTEQNGTGDEQSDLATTLDDLGSIYFAEGKYAQAEPIYRQAAALADRNFAKEPLAATIFSDLARLNAAEGHYATAEPLHRRALRSLEEAFAASSLRTTH